LSSYKKKGIVSPGCIDFVAPYSIAAKKKEVTVTIRGRQDSNLRGQSPHDF
jgi:hypothetical protein